MNNYLYRVISEGYTRSLVIEYTYNFIQKVCTNTTEISNHSYSITKYSYNNYKSTEFLVFDPCFQNVKFRWENHADLSFVVLIVKALVLVSFHLHLFPSHMQVYSCDLKWRNKYLWFVHATIGFSAIFFFFFWFNHSPVLFSWV